MARKRPAMKGMARHLWSGLKCSKALYTSSVHFLGYMVGSVMEALRVEEASKPSIMYEIKDTSIGLARSDCGSGKMWGEWIVSAINKGMFKGFLIEGKKYTMV